MNRMRERIERALKQGLLLSMALGCKSEPIGEPLVPYPKQAYPVCTEQVSDISYGGEGNGFGTECCVTAQCFTPVSGECPAADEVGEEELADFPPGSGSCECLPVEGPFVPRSDDQPATPGRCCYLVAAIDCMGRPLLVAGAPRVAGVTRRADWASRPSWV